MVKCSSSELMEGLKKRKKPLKKKKPEAHNKVVDLPAAPSEVPKMTEVPTASIEARGEVEATVASTEVREVTEIPTDQ